MARLQNVQQIKCRIFLVHRKMNVAWTTDSISFLVLFKIPKIRNVFSDLLRTWKWILFQKPFELCKSSKWNVIKIYSAYFRFAIQVNSRISAIFDSIKYLFHINSFWAHLWLNFIRTQHGVLTFLTCFLIVIFFLCSILLFLFWTRCSFSSTKVNFTNCISPDVHRLYCIYSIWKMIMWHEYKST